MINNCSAKRSKTNFCLSLWHILQIRASINLYIMGKLGTTEIILIIAVILLLFGGKKIPELMKGLGNGIKEFKNASKAEDQPASKKEEEEKK